MANVNDWNRGIIEEFRANGGKLGGMWAGRNLLLLTTTGAKSRQPRTNPVAFQRDGERLLIFGSKAGAPTHPDWYHNHPQVTVEVGTDRYEATATVLSGEERDRFYAKQSQVSPAFAEYQKKTTRIIPVVALTRRVG